MKVAPVISLSGAVVKDMEVLNVNAPNAPPPQRPCYPLLAHYLPRALTPNLRDKLMNSNESIPYSIQNCSCELLPRIARASRSGQRSRQLATSRRREVEELSTRCKRHSCVHRSVIPSTKDLTYDVRLGVSCVLNSLA